MEQFFEVNKKMWNARTDVHLSSEFYDVDSFIEKGNSLNEIELELLGNVSDKNILHLQCHFGQDTLSLARMGALVTGLDFSDKAITAAKQLAEKTHLDAEFVCANVYHTDQHLNHKLFDIVFTSYGTIGWLPDLNKWAEQIRKRLRVGGKFVFAEFHPVLWMFDSQFSKVDYSYFNREIIEEQEVGTYTDGGNHLHTQSFSWNHSLGEVMEALRKNNLIVDSFQEFDYSPYNCFANTVKTEKGYQIDNLRGKIPMVYALTCTAI